MMFFPKKTEIDWHKEFDGNKHMSCACYIFQFTFVGLRYFDNLLKTHKNKPIVKLSPKGTKLCATKEHLKKYHRVVRNLINM
jgi:hypothetical protein